MTTEEKIAIQDLIARIDGERIKQILDLSARVSRLERLIVEDRISKLNEDVAAIRAQVHRDFEGIKEKVREDQS